jgi:hypothetical protein
MCFIPSTSAARYCQIVRSLNSSLSTAVGYVIDRRGSTPGRSQIFLFSTVSRPALGPTQPPFRWVPRAISPRVKRLGREADHSPPSSAEVNNDGAIPPLPHMSSWHSDKLIKHRDYFISRFNYLLNDRVKETHIPLEKTTI